MNDFFRNKNLSEQKKIKLEYYSVCFFYSELISEKTFFKNYEHLKNSSSQEEQEEFEQLYEEFLALLAEQEEKKETFIFHLKKAEEFSQILQKEKIAHEIKCALNTESIYLEIKNIEGDVRISDHYGCSNFEIDPFDFEATSKDCLEKIKKEIKNN